jgi:hypothetical protein
MSDPTLDRSLHRTAIFRMNECDQSLHRSVELLARHTVNFVQRVSPSEAVCGDIPIPQTDFTRPRRHPQPLFAFKERQFRATSTRHIQHRRQITPHGAIRSELRRVRRLHVPMSDPVVRHLHFK